MKAIIHRPTVNFRIFAIASLALTFYFACPLTAAEPALGPAGEAGKPHSQEKLHEGGKPETSQPDAGSHDDKLSVTHHQIVVNGRTLNYEATAGTMLMKDEAGKPRANFFFVAYRLENHPPAAGNPSTSESSSSSSTEPSTEPAFDPAKRPITFVFNGGPGAAAVWLHLGALGPERVALTEDGRAIGPPYRLVDNPETWLDMTDLVFIDPVGTGYSRPAEGVKADEFYGVENDVESVGDFIRLYTTRYERWLSPKFLAGESYGTTRAAALSQYLLDRFGLDLNGIVFISTVLDFQTLGDSGGGVDLPYALNLPSYAATAWYHHKLDAGRQKDLPSLLAEVKAWAMGDYLTALGKGTSLDARQRADVVMRLSHYTGLSEDFIDKSNLRISASAFRKELLNNERKIIGRFDTRLTGDDPRPAEDTPEFDPSFPQYFGAYTAGFNDYVRRVLKFDSDLDYEVLSSRVRPWDFGAHGNGYLDVARSLDSAMHSSPHLKVMFASGYFDLATPFMGTDYTLSHMNLSPDLLANITRTYYPAGHMVYHPRASLEKLKQDAAAFMLGATSGGATTQTEH